MRMAVDLMDGTALRIIGGSNVIPRHSADIVDSMLDRQWGEDKTGKTLWTVTCVASRPICSKNLFIILITRTTIFFRAFKKIISFKSTYNFVVIVNLHQKVTVCFGVWLALVSVLRRSFPLAVLGISAMNSTPPRSFLCTSQRSAKSIIRHISHTVFPTHVNL